MPILWEYRFWKHQQRTQQMLRLLSLKWLRKSKTEWEMHQQNKHKNKLSNQERVYLLEQKIKDVDVKLIWTEKKKNQVLQNKTKNFQSQKN